MGSSHLPALIDWSRRPPPAVTHSSRLYGPPRGPSTDRIDPLLAERAAEVGGGGLLAREVLPPPGDELGGGLLPPAGGPGRTSLLDGGDGVLVLEHHAVPHRLPGAIRHADRVVVLVAGADRVVAEGLLGDRAVLHLDPHLAPEVLEGGPLGVDVVG